MTQENLRLDEETLMDMTKSPSATLSKIAGKGPIMRLGRNESMRLGVLEAI